MKNLAGQQKNFFKEFKLVYCLTLLRIDHPKKKHCVNENKTIDRKKFFGKFFSFLFVKLSNVFVCYTIR